jgi:hypothetical protein
VTAAALDNPAVIEPGVYQLTDEQYHADPVPGGSLSSTGARRILPPGCPAKYRYEVDNPPAASRAFDVGSAAHHLVLGTGPRLIRVEHGDWRTKAAREQRDAAHAAGAIPLLADEHDQVQAMAAALRQHPIAAALFDPDRGGQPEQSLFWVDGPSGVWRRSRLDWLPAGGGTGRAIVADYKTTLDASPDSIAKALERYGYHQQAAFYLDAGPALGLWGDDAAFVLVFQEKAPPYLVTVVEPDPSTLRIGRERNRRAIDLFAQCQATGRWPGYADDVLSIALPAWAQARHHEEY